jgi:hypothetical protein
MSSAGDCQDDHASQISRVAAGACRRSAGGLPDDFVADEQLAFGSAIAELGIVRLESIEFRFIRRIERRSAIAVPAGVGRVERFGVSVPSIGVRRLVGFLGRLYVSVIGRVERLLWQSVAGRGRQLEHQRRFALDEPGLCRLKRRSGVAPERPGLAVRRTGCRRGWSGFTVRRTGCRRGWSGFTVRSARLRQSGVAGGRARFASGRSGVSGRRPGLAGRRAKFSGRRSGFSGRRSGLAGGRSGVTGRRPRVAGRRSGLSGRRSILR